MYEEEPGNSLRNTQIIHNLPALVLTLPVTEQGYSSDTKAKKGNVWPLEARSGDMGGLQRCCSLNWS